MTDEKDHISLALVSNMLPFFFGHFSGRVNVSSG